MKAKDMVSSEIPSLQSRMKVSEGLSVMDEARRDCLPVEEDGLYRGLVRNADLLLREDRELPIGDDFPDKPCVAGEAHPLEAINLLAQLSLPLLPVVEDGSRYCGCISQSSALLAVARLCNTGHKGAIIELEMFPGDYSVVELTRLVEDNGCKVVNLLASPSSESGRINVLLRIDREDAMPVLRSLERFDYRVSGCYQSPSSIDERTERRFRELMYYLEM